MTGREGQDAVGPTTSGPAGWVWTWGPALLCMVAIFLASSMPNLGPLPGDISDKTGHFTGYALLGALVLRAVAHARWSGVTPMSALVSWGICLVYGASDEFHQRFVPGRTAALDDWVADAAGSGVAIGVLTLAAIVRRRPTRTV